VVGEGRAACTFCILFWNKKSESVKKYKWLCEVDDSFVLVIMCSQTHQISPGGSIKDVYSVTICMLLQYTENLAKIVLCSLNLNLPFNGKKRHYIWGWGQDSLHLFLSSFLFSLLLEAIIKPFCISVPESSFCKINGIIDNIKKYAHLL
jgi:hypothetical protein